MDLREPDDCTSEGYQIWLRWVEVQDSWEEPNRYLFSLSEVGVVGWNETWSRQCQLMRTSPDGAKRFVEDALDHIGNGGSEPTPDAEWSECI